MRGYERLLELQELDLSIDRLESRRREIESGAAADEARKRADQVEQRVGELRLDVDAVRREETRYEHELSTIDLRIQAEEKRLYDGSVANPKELSSIQAELENLRRRKTRLEDEELEQMERREELESGLPSLEAELAEARDRLAEIESSDERELVEIGRALEERRAERAELLPVFDEELVELYEDLRGSKKGVGAASLRDGVCQGCHEKLSAMGLDKLKRAEGVRRCEHCRRILVVE